MKEFKEFIDKKIAVVFDSEKEIDKFYELCVKNNKINETVITKKDDVLKSYVYFSKEYQVPLVSYGGAYDYLRVKASEFLASAPTIEIFQSKQTVVCLKKQDGKVVAVGKAKCNPDDKFNFDFGAGMAFDRMQSDITLRYIARAGETLPKGLKEGIEKPFCNIKTLKNGIKIRKQDHYEVGDKVLMKKKTSLTLLDEMKYCTGKICTIKDPDGIELEESGGYCFLNGDIKGKVIE